MRTRSLIASVLTTSAIGLTCPEAQAVEIKPILLPPGVKIVLTHGEAQDYQKVRTLVPPPYRIAFDLLGENIKLADRGNGVNIIYSMGCIIAVPR